MEKKHSNKLCYGTIITLFVATAIVDFGDYAWKLSVKIGCDILTANVEGARSFWYLAMPSIIAVLIFYSQTVSSKTNAENLGKAIDSLKGFSIEDMKVKLLEWINTGSSKRVIILYFPYSIIPGFWIDINIYLDYLRKILDIKNSDKIRIYMLGPACDHELFQFVTNMVSNGYKEGEIGIYSENSLFHEFEKLDGETNREARKSKIEDMYNAFVTCLNRIIEGRENVKLRPFPDNRITSLECKPGFSFIMRITSSSNVDILLSDIGGTAEKIEWKWTHNKIKLENILDPPASYYLSDEKMSRLMCSHILQCISEDEQLINEIEQFVK